MIDSTEAAVISAALEHVPGRAIINSINMENGRKRIDDVVPLAKKHGAALVALTIDPVGMAKTRERKLEVAKAIYDIVVGEYGLAAEDLIYDALTFTLATGDAEWIESAKETIEGIRLIKRELPGVFTILGVSNVSFGLDPAARHVLNSVFLHHCVEAGLDAAIVNPAHIRPYAEISAEERALADDLVFNRRPDALQRFIEYFEAAKARGESPDGATTVGDQNAAFSELSPEARVHWMVLHRKKEGIEDALDAAQVREHPVRVLNEVLLPAMKEVGDKFGAGELILPFVLQSAEVMKKAVKHLEQFLEKAEGYTKGKVVLATVYGDVHDIGKSLVNTILSNNGYTVFDLGKQVPVNTIIEKALEVGADAIGLSALLVSTSKQMPLCVQELDKRGIQLPVLIGGAAINRRFGRRAMFVEGERAYESGVFYCKDAFEGLETMDALQDDDRRTATIEKVKSDARRDVFLHGNVGKDVRAGIAGGERSDVTHDHAVPAAPFWGTKVLDDIPLPEVLDLLDLDELYRLQWGGRGSGAEYDRMVREEFQPTLERLKAEAIADGWVKPQAVYGYFPVQSAGNELIIYEPEPYAKDGSLVEKTRFHFPRQEGRERLCIADYFRASTSGDVDVVAFQVVTVGDEATRRFEALQAAGEYSEAFYSHGIAVEAAEATAEWLHRRVRRELGIPGGRGKRYSWGYGACPDLEDHAQLFKILPAEEALGMELTSAFQLIPEQSTAAILVHHPQSKYYAVRTAAEGAGASA
jgi:5-methyltetrahydrofolate--homocysteine methyltransferase